MLYGGAAVTAVVLCIYLLLRKGNAIAADITPPMRLRRWAAAFFAVVALCHIWWGIFYMYSWDDASVSYMALGMLDCVTLLPVAFGTLLAMLQDRRRPLWPFVAALMPIVLLGGLQIALPGIDFVAPALVYVLALCAVFTVYMAISVWQYGRWLRDNYSDLQHKEVMQSHTLLIVLMSLLVSDQFAFESTFMLFLVRVFVFVLYGLLLWRVETLPQLDVASKREDFDLPDAVASPETGLPSPPTQNPVEAIGQLLAQHCDDAQLYLQDDLTLQQLAVALGTNRTYLSQYFHSKGLNFNIYINDLRIRHFVALYQKAVAEQRPFTVQQLAGESGYRSYSTFSLAFKQRMGQSVTAWIRAKEASKTT